MCPCTDTYCICTHVIIILIHNKVICYIAQSDLLAMQVLLGIWLTVSPDFTNRYQIIIESVNIYSQWFYNPSKQQGFGGNKTYHMHVSQIILTDINKVMNEFEPSP